MILYNLRVSPTEVHKHKNYHAVRPFQSVPQNTVISNNQHKQAMQNFRNYVYVYSNMYFKQSQNINSKWTKHLWVWQMVRSHTMKHKTEFLSWGCFIKRKCRKQVFRQITNNFPRRVPILNIFIMWGSRAIYQQVQKYCCTLEVISDGVFSTLEFPCESLWEYFSAGNPFFFFFFLWGE